MTCEWRLSPEAQRQVRVMGHIAEGTSKGELFADSVAIYSELGDDATGIAFAELTHLDDIGMIEKHFATGGLQSLRAKLTASGREFLNTVDNHLASKAERAWAARISLLDFAYDGDAVDARSGVGWQDMFLSGFGTYWTGPFEIKDLERASAFLAEKGLITGQEVAEFTGPVVVWLTPDGEACAEDWQCDVKEFLRMKESKASGDIFNFHASNNQVVKGDHAKQEMNVGVTSEELQVLFEGLVTMVRGLGLDPDHELDEPLTTTQADLASEAPTGEPGKKMLRKLRKVVATGAQPGVQAVITKAIEAVGDDLATRVQQGVEHAHKFM